ncbi:MAG: hypothetical protein ACYCOU_03145 [Sulfobacillus sp.]
MASNPGDKLIGRDLTGGSRAPGNFEAVQGHLLAGRPLAAANAVREILRGNPDWEHELRWRCLKFAAKYCIESQPQLLLHLHRLFVDSDQQNPGGKNIGPANRFDRLVELVAMLSLAPKKIKVYQREIQDLEPRSKPGGGSTGSKNRKSAIPDLASQARTVLGNEIPTTEVGARLSQAILLTGRLPKTTANLVLLVMARLPSTDGRSPSRGGIRGLIDKCTVDELRQFYQLFSPFQRQIPSWEFLWQMAIRHDLELSRDLFYWKFFCLDPRWDIKLVPVNRQHPDIIRAILLSH